MSYFIEKTHVLEVVQSLCGKDTWQRAWTSSELNASSPESAQLSLATALAANATAAHSTGVASSLLAFSAEASAAPCSYDPAHNSTWLITVLNNYHEQPNIVRSSLRELVEPLMAAVDTNLATLLAARSTSPGVAVAVGEGDNKQQLQHVHVLCKVLYVLCKVAGYKHVARMLPHEVAHLERCFGFFSALLEADRSRNRSRDKGEGKGEQEAATGLSVGGAMGVGDAADHYDWSNRGVSGDGHYNWETRYVLLLWLSVLSLIPFDLTSMDSAYKAMATGAGAVAHASAGAAPTAVGSTDAGTVTVSSSATGFVATSARSSGLVRGLLALEVGYLSDPGPCREMAAVALACVLTRPDAEDSGGGCGGLLSEYMSWCHKVLTDAAADPKTVINGHTRASMQFVGVLYSVVQIFKRGARGHLLRFADGVLADLRAITELTEPAGTGAIREEEGGGGEVGQDTTGSGAGGTVPLEIASIMTRKLLCKCVQRVGLALLVPRVAAWRYSRGKRTLAIGTGGKAAGPTAGSCAPGQASAAAGGKPTFISNVTAQQHKQASAGAGAGVDTGVPDPEDAVEGADDDEENALADYTACLYHQQLCTITEFLLRSLADGDTVVRWSAAKGIGRITMRLPLLMAHDVIMAVLRDAFWANSKLQTAGKDKGKDKDKEVTVVSASDEDAWHGGCLVLAELARRGLLLPMPIDELVGEAGSSSSSGGAAAAAGSSGIVGGDVSHLQAALPFIAYAMRFDVLRGQHSVGAHVRDAACYVCWAMARAYSPDVLRPHMRLLTHSMLLTTCFDREVNCRRAASAALQEHVGRQGAQNFLHGIEVITIADYFALGSRTNSFTVIAPAVAALGIHPGSSSCDLTHWRCFMTALQAPAKLGHWDVEVRELAARGMGRLVQLLDVVVPVATGEDVRGSEAGASTATGASAPLLFHRSVHAEVEACIASLVQSSLSTTLYVRHGALLALTQLLDVLFLYMPSLHSHGAGVGTILSEELVARVVGVVPAVEKARLYRGRGGEIMRAAACALVQAIARCALPIPQLRTQQYLVEVTLTDNLKQPHEAVQQAAAAALRQFLHTYSTAPGAAPRPTFPVLSNERLASLTIAKYLKSVCNVVNANAAAVNKETLEANAAAATACGTTSDDAAAAPAAPGPVRDDDTVAIKRGYALALGALPLHLLLISHCDVAGGKQGAVGKLTTDLTPAVILPQVAKDALAGTVTAPAGSAALHTLLWIVGAAGGINLGVGGVGETDAEFRRNLLESVVGIAEKLEEHVDGVADGFCSPSQAHWDAIATLLCRALTDYSSDKRGDTGSWSRLVALRGAARLLLLVNRSARSLPQEQSTGSHACGRVCFSRFPPAAGGSSPTTFSVGNHVATVFGVGAVTGVHGCDAAGRGTLSVAFPAYSLGHQIAAAQFHSIGEGGGGDSTVAAGSVQVLEMPVAVGSGVRIINAGPGAPPADGGDEYLEWPVETSAEASVRAPTATGTGTGTGTGVVPTCNTLTGSLLFSAASTLALLQGVTKQMCERLDGVRDVAGGVLQALLESTDPVIRGVPDRVVLMRGLQSVRLLLQQRNEEFRAKMGKSLASHGASKDGEGAVGAGGESAEAGASDGAEAMGSGSDHSGYNCYGVAAVLPWAQPATSFPFAMSLLEDSDGQMYFNAVLAGLVTAVGGLTESVVKEASANLLRWCKSMNSRRNFHALSKLQTGLVELLRSHAKNDAIVLPTLKTLEVLLRDNVFDYLLEQRLQDVANKADREGSGAEAAESPASSFVLQLVTSLRHEAHGSSSVKKLKQCVGLFVLLMNMPAAVVQRAPVAAGGKKTGETTTTDTTEVRLCVKSLVALLGHRYPKVRKFAAEQLYLQCIAHPNAVDLEGGGSVEGRTELQHTGFVGEHAVMNEVTRLLLETAWEEQGPAGAAQSTMRLNPSSVNKTNAPTASAGAGSTAHLNAVRRSRDAVARLMRFDVAAPKQPSSADQAGAESAANPNAAVADESDSYESLVREAGY